LPGARFLGTLRDTYLLAEDPEGLLLVDRGALEETLRYRTLRGGERARFPVARIVHLAPKLVRRLGESGETLPALGFEWERFGDGDIALKSHPRAIAEEDAERSFTRVMEALEAMAPETRGERERMLDQSCAALAREGSLAGPPPGSLGPDEGQALLGRLAEIGQNWTAPSGRPVLYRLSFHAIEKHFERV
jgi:DNA mismatch repair protein MutL